jgi:azurin
MRFLRRLVKFARIRACRKGTTKSHHNDPIKVQFFCGAHSIQQTLTHGMANGIHRRIVQFDDAKVIFVTKVYGHERSYGFAWAGIK